MNACDDDRCGVTSDSAGDTSVPLKSDRLPVVVRIPAGPLGSLKCDPPKGNGRRPQESALPLKYGHVGGKTFS